MRKWLKKRFTFMIIADANSNVLRFRISAWTISLIPAVLVVLSALTLTFYIIQQRSEGTNLELQNQLLGKTQEYEHTVSEKNQTIEHLQNELIRLSQQAEEVRTKIAELKKLENEMKSLTGNAAADKPSEAAISAAAGSGIGGDARALTEADIDQLVVNTENSYANLDAEMTVLFGSLAETKQKVEDMQRKLAVTPTLWPTDSRTITSPFGYRMDPFTLKPSYHNGIDISGHANDPIYVTADGVVESVGWDPTGGNNIIVNHSDGLKTRYMHLNEILVGKGDKVKKGQQIGRMGSTGRSTGTHLHYGVMKNGETIDPRPYLKASRKEE